MIDQRFFGSTTTYEDGKIRGTWRKRPHLLEPGEKKLMEEFVNLKLEDRDTRRLTWDPDEYTVEWIERLKMKKEEREKMEKREEN